MSWNSRLSNLKQCKFKRKKKVLQRDLAEQARKNEPKCAKKTKITQLLKICDRKQLDFPPNSK